MRRGIIYIFIVFILLSCDSKTKFNKPDNLIEQETMVNIWTDIFLGTAAKSIKTKELKVYKNFMPLILAKYQIDSLQFVNSNLYYTSKIDDYEKMFVKIEQNLEDLKKKHTKDPFLDSILELEKVNGKLD